MQMALGGQSNTEKSVSNYDERYSLSFRRGPAGENPFFQVRKYFPDREELKDTNKVKGVFKGVIYNEEKTITNKEGKAVTIPPKFAIAIEDVVEGLNCVYYVEISTECGAQLRPLLNSLLGVNVGESIELATFISRSKTDGKSYKVISASNPDKQKEIQYAKDGQTKTTMVNENYPWVFSSNELPEVEVIKNKAGEVKSVDDSAQLLFLREKIAERFDKTEEKELSVEDIPF